MISKNYLRQNMAKDETAVTFTNITEQKDLKVISKPSSTKNTPVKTTSLKTLSSVSTVTASDVAAQSRKENLVCIYDAAAGAYLFLDGEVQIEHNFTLNISDKASSQEKDEEVNNAKVQPDEIKIEGVVSNVMRRSGALTSQYGNRVASATQYLYDLQKNRTLCQVITNLITYNDMLPKSIAISQDEGTGADSANFTIVMHQRVQPKKKNFDANTSSSEDTENRTGAIMTYSQDIMNSSSLGH